MRTTEKDQEIKSSQDAALWNNTFVDTDHLHLFQILIISGVTATEAALEHLLDGLHSQILWVVFYCISPTCKRSCWLTYTTVLCLSYKLNLCCCLGQTVSIYSWCDGVTQRLHDYKQKVLNLILFLFIQLQAHTPTFTVVSLWLYSLLHQLFWNTVLIASFLIPSLTLFFRSTHQNLKHAAMSIPMVLVPSMFMVVLKLHKQATKSSA